MTIKFTVAVDGYAVGMTANKAAPIEAAYVARGVAVYGGDGYPPASVLGPGGNATSLVDGAGKIIVQAKASGDGFDPFGQNISTTNITTLTPQSGSVATVTNVMTAEGPGVRAVSDTADKYIEMTFALPYPMLIKNLGIIAQANGVTQATLAIYASTSSSFLSASSISKGIAVNAGSGKNGAQSHGLLTFTLCGQSPSNVWTNITPVSLDTTLFTHIRVRITPASGQIADFTVVKWIANPAAKSRIALTFDDGLIAQYTHVAPLLQARGLRASFAVIPDLIGSSSAYMNLSQLRELKANGHEIITHGPIGGAGSLIDNYGSISAMVADAVACRDSLIAKGLITTENERSVYVWPQGKFQSASGNTDLLEAMKAAGFTTGRSVTRYLGYSHAAAKATRYGGLIAPIFGHIRSGVSSGDEDTVITNCTTAITYAVSTGLDAVGMFHNIIADQGVFAATSNNDIEVSRFITILDAIVTQIATGKATNELFSSFA